MDELFDNLFTGRFWIYAKIYQYLNYFSSKSITFTFQN